MMLEALKSLNVTPRFLPLIVITVPPSGGPDMGDILVIEGAGHCVPIVIRDIIKHSSETVHEVSHHPHWKVVRSLVLTHAEQSVAMGTQSYRVTAR